MTGATLKPYDIPALKIIGAQQIEQWLSSNPQRVFDLVRDVYVAHAAGKTVNPDSYFLRFPDSDKTRIIALPASIEDDDPIAGIKWIASFPENVAHGADRASAVLILNDRKSGYPLACLEGSAISAARTAASAAVGARYLHPTPGRIGQLGVIGCGPIAYRTVTLLVQLGWRIDGISLTDLSQERAGLFRDKCAAFGIPTAIAGLDRTVGGSDMVLFATSAVTPTVHDAGLFAHAPTVLHMSLRDLAPEIVLAAQNVADDVDHCLKANTSLDLAQRLSGGRGFIDGDIAGAIRGEIVPDAARTRVFSPFGMGVLDLAVARALLQTMREQDMVVVPGFFPVPYVSAGGAAEAPGANAPLHARVA
jgi:2,3-diaminopropionate biosynthesis protein SbnB